MSETGCALHPLKINGWNLKITQLKREIIWSKHPVLGFKMLVFGGCREWGNQSPHHDHVLRAGQKSISRLFSCDIPISSSISRVSRKWKWRQVMPRRWISKDSEIRRFFQILDYHIFPKKHTLLETNISLPKSLLKMIFLFQRWDMLVP